jgi:Adenylate and Guanylate cyclase catalytic domain
VVDVYYPIINDISHVDISKDYNYSAFNKTIVGIIAVSIYWRELIRDILPPGSNGVTIVVQSPCNLPFTYEFRGSDIKYLGVGDNHDVEYDYLLHESKLVDLNSFALREGTYTGARINKNICPYTLHLYPSDVMKFDFTSRNAVIALVSVLLIFAFTSFVFFIYDWTVERRQNKVMSSAIRSSAIVDSLFPSTVRNQLYQAQEEMKQRNIRPSSGSDIAGEDMSNTSGLLNGSGLSQFLNQGSIAQVYPDTTVIFADIVGFTSWSSTREPTQVFHLLETLYAGFDALAKMYGVYKIETIGDSYVAVVGLPKSRKGHAVIMAKFANDCRTKMMELLQELEGFLGPVRDLMDLVLQRNMNTHNHTITFIFDT